MNINIEFVNSQALDGELLSPPPAYQQAVLAAAAIFDALLTDNITINIQVSYGAGFPLLLDDQSGSAGGPWNGANFNYDQIRNLLLSNASSGDTIFNSLPADSSALGSSNIWLSTAQEKALGLRAANDPAVDGAFGIGTAVPSALWTSMALKEIGHVLGRWFNGNTLDIADLFRFTSPGV